MFGRVFRHVYRHAFSWDSPASACAWTCVRTCVRTCVQPCARWELIHAALSGIVARRGDVWKDGRAGGRARAGWLTGGQTDQCKTDRLVDVHRCCKRWWNSHSEGREDSIFDLDRIKSNAKTARLSVLAARRSISRSIPNAVESKGDCAFIQVGCKPQDVAFGPPCCSEIFANTSWETFLLRGCWTITETT